MAYSKYTGGTHFPHFNASDDFVPPWLYSNYQQCKIDAHINCIVVPSNLSNEFAFNNMDRWMDGWMDRWMDGWIDRWIDG